MKQDIQKLILTLALLFVITMPSSSQVKYDWQISDPWITASFGNDEKQTVDLGLYDWYEKDYPETVEFPEWVKNNGTMKPGWWKVTSISRESGSTGHYRETKTPTKVILPGTIEKIWDHAFYNCVGLKEINIPGSVKCIADYAFNNCKSLTSINLPNSLEQIWNFPFKNSGLISITLPGSLKRMTSPYFEGCASLKEINVNPENNYFASKDGVLFNKDFTKLLKYPENKDGETYIIPNSVTIIEDSAFNNCNNLKKVVISNSVTKIGDYAFCYCENLKSVEFSNSITEIGNYAFSNCDNLSRVEIPNSVKTIGNAAFMGCDNLSSVEIPNSVKTIGALAFNACHNLKSITIPESVTKIGSYAFNSLRQTIIKISSPSSLDSIGSSAFSDCKNLTGEIELKENKYYGQIDDDAFRNCNITKFTINGPFFIGNYAFYGNKNLSTFYSMFKEPPIIGDSIFSKPYPIIIIPQGSLNNYLFDYRWARFYPDNLFEYGDPESGTGITANKNKEFEISLGSTGIILKEAEGENVRVYTVDGRLVFSEKRYANEVINLQRGTYIVRVGKKTVKVVR